MSIETAREYLKQWNRDSDVIEFDVSSATVELAVKALQTEEARIAKTLSFTGLAFVGVHWGRVSCREL